MCSNDRKELSARRARPTARHRQACSGTSIQTAWVDLIRRARGVDLSDPHVTADWLNKLPPLVRPGPRYERAPVVEAIIDVRCDAPDPGADPEYLREAADRSVFPSEEAIWEVRGTVGVAEAGLTGETSARTVGYRFRRTDPDQAVQVRLNGYSFSWLAQYDDWERLTTEAEGHWLYYLDVAKPIRVTRLGVRFINRIVVPTRPVEINDYLRIGVNVPAYLPQSVTEYLLRVQVPIEELDSVVRISSTLEESDEDETALILDIDAMMAVDIDLSSMDARGSIPSLLGILRLAKNYTFESCITDATRRLIK